jgi:ribosomal protein L40E
MSESSGSTATETRVAGSSAAVPSRAVGDHWVCDRCGTDNRPADVRCRACASLRAGLVEPDDGFRIERRVVVALVIVLIIAIAIIVLGHWAFEDFGEGWFRGW